MTERVRAAYMLFFEAVREGGIERILKTASKIFDSPVLFTDENYRLIGQVPSEPIGNYIWDTLYIKNILPLDVIWQYQNLFLDDMLDMYKPFYADWGPVADYPRIFAEIFIGNKVLGHAAVFLGKKLLREDDLEITQIFVDALNIEVSRKRNGQDLWQPSLSVYFRDLLDNEASFEMKMLAIQKLNQKISGDFIIIVTPIGTKASQRAFASYIVSSFNVKFRNTISVIYENSIVTAMGAINKRKFDPNSNNLLKQIVDVLSEHKMLCGVSDCFSGLKEAFMRYRQAELTAKLVSERKNTYFGIYGDYAPGQIFLAVSNTDHPNTFIHPALSKMKDYDKSNNTEYYNTLKTYSLSMHNKCSAASQLAIHRNTLLYRLNRIEDLFGVSYEDEKTAIHLLCSFLLVDAYSGEL